MPMLECVLLDICMRIKICGLTTIEDVQAAALAGADALGFVFYSASKRSVSIAQAAQLVAAMPPFVQSVGLFVNPEADFVREVLREVPLDCLQFHGDESAAFCQSFSRRWIKAVPMRDLSLSQASAYCEKYPQADGFLFDAFGAKVSGGSGEVFDWKRIPKLDKPVILAGGLSVENVADAVKQLRPWAIDVSSGVESAPARKSFAKMQAFISQARAATL